MGRKPRAVGTVPRFVAPRQPPQARAAGAVPRGDPRAQPPAQRVSHAPKARGVGAPPNPRKPKLVRDVDGGILKDLFAFFPDLPRPARPAARVVARRRKARR